jgi:type 2A phosphatase activator TIP41
MLGPDNPIKAYGEVSLYEDEFADRGYSKANARFRVMDNCFFVLLRSYVRIDHVCCRIIDTRIFHDFSKDYLVRDCQQLECSYEELT